jgi:WD40 repeat protein
MRHVAGLAIAAGSLFISPNADRFVTIDPAGKVSLWSNSAARIELGEIRGAQPSAVRRIFFSSDGRRFCTGGESSTARVWDTETGKELLAIPWRVYQARFSPDGKRLVTIGSEKIARVWDLEKGQVAVRLEGHEAGVTALDYSPDGEWIASSSLDGSVRIWSAHEGQTVHTLRPAERPEACAVTFSSDGSCLFVGLADGHGLLYDLSFTRVRVYLD